jgi:Gpi18-like mannosyltransferase
MRGHVHDIEQLKAWTETAVTTNPLGIYSASTANYPPLGLLPLVIVGHFYRTFISPEFDTASTILTALLKLPGITADLITAVILYRYLTKYYNRRWGLIGLVAYAFNPAIIYDTAWWGQLESLVTLPMLLSVIALSNGRIRWAWLWLAVAVLVKPQAAVIAPVIFIATLKMADWRKLAQGIVTALTTALIILMPFILVGQLPVLIAQIRASAGRQLFLTMNAHNLWYLVTFGRGSFAAREANPILDTQPLLGPLTGWHIGLLLLLAWTLFTVHRLLFTLHHPLPAALFWAAAAMIIGFYMLPAESHERYLFPAFALLVPLLPGRRPYQLIYILFTATFFLNLLWVDSAVPLPAFNQNLTLAIPLAALNVALLLYFYLQPHPPKQPYAKPTNTL